MHATVVSPTTAGLSVSDLIAIFGVLLTALMGALGVLFMFILNGIHDRISEVKDDTAADIATLRTENREQFTALWSELRLGRAKAPIVAGGK